MLRTYLAHHKISATAFAAEIAVSGAALHRYINGERIPRPEVMQRICAATRGSVQPNDFFPFPQPQDGPPLVAA